MIEEEYTVSLIELSEGFRSGRFSLRSYVRELKRFFEEREPLVRAFVTEMPECFECLLCEIDRLEARFPETSVELIRKGQTIGSDVLAACRNGREKLRDQILTAMKYNHFSVLIAPAAVGPAPKGLEYTGDAVVKYPAAAAGPEGLPPGHEPFRGGAWPGGSCGVSWHILMNIPIDLCGPTCGEYSLWKVAGGTAYGASNGWLLDG